MWKLKVFLKCTGGDGRKDILVERWGAPEKRSSVSFKNGKIKSKGFLDIFQGPPFKNWVRMKTKEVEEMDREGWKEDEKEGGGEDG